MNKKKRLGLVLSVLSLLIAMGHTAKSNILDDFQAIGKGQSATDREASNMKLSDLLKSFKQKFDVDILFEDAAVEGKTVDAAMVDAKGSVEANLSKILAKFDLKFRKIKERSYLVFQAQKPKQGPNDPQISVPQRAVPNGKTTGQDEKKNSETELIATQQPKDLVVQGVVRDEKGAAMQGVTVKDKKKGTTSITEADGSFSIRVSAPNSVLVFTFQGYEMEEVNVGSADKALSVYLKSTTKALEEVVVVGYGTQKRKDLTGSIAKVNISDLQKAPVRSFEEALGGRVSGVQVTSNDGQPGSGVSIVIRGNNSLTQDNSPLYVVDGIPMENPNNNAINPADIESMEILKDASATAIYGARAANGVIMITTKKGVAGKTKFTFNRFYGKQEIINKISVLGPYDFVDYISQTDTLNAKSYLSGSKTLESYKNVKGIDWQDKIFRTAPILSNAVSMSGGSGASKYYLSLSAFDQRGIVRFTGYERYQGRFRFDHNISDKLKMALNLNYSALKGYGTTPSNSASSLSNSSSQTSNLMYSVWGYRPVTGDTTVNLLSGQDPAFADNPNDSRFNPLETVSYEVRNRFSNTVYGNFSMEYEPIKNLKLKSVIGYTNDVDRNEEFNGSNTRLGSPRTIQGRNNGVNGSFLYTTTNSYVSENTASYGLKLLDKHSFDIVGGFTCQGVSGYKFGASASKLPNESLGLAGLDEGTPSKVPSSRTMNTLSSFLGRVNYGFKGIYLATVSFRADGSSKFPDNNKWGYFPSASFAWHLSEEKFFKVPYISDAKLRSSFGFVGNNRVSDFASYATLSSPIVQNYSFGGRLTNSAVTNNLGNNHLKWETTEQADLGLDLSLFNNRANLTIDYYHKTTRDLLLNAYISQTSGFTQAYKNIGRVENKGLEVSVNGKVYEKGKFKWTASFNIAFNRNKILALTDNQEALLPVVNWDNQWSGLPAYIAKVGQPMGLFYGYIWQGNYQYADFNKSASGHYTLKRNVASNTTSPNPNIEPGDIKYKDLNGDLVINDNDKTIIGNANPKYIGGLTNGFTYREFDVNLFFQYAYGNQLLNANRLVFEGNSGRVLQNQFTTVLNRWTPTNPNNEMYAYGGAGDKVYSSRVIEDGSYFRLKTVQLGYTLPAKWANKAKLTGVRLYVSAQNIYTLTKYTGFDPEVSAYPTALTPGFDYSVYPRAKTYTAGINVNF